MIYESALMLYTLQFKLLLPLLSFMFYFGCSLYVFDITDTDAECRKFVTLNDIAVFSYLSTNDPLTSIYLNAKLYSGSNPIPPPHPPGDDLKN